MWYNDLKETVSIRVKTKIQKIAQCEHWLENHNGKIT